MARYVEREGAKLWSGKLLLVFSCQINYMKYEEIGQGIDRKTACRKKQHAVEDKERIWRNECDVKL